MTDSDRLQSAHATSLEWIGWIVAGSLIAVSIGLLYRYAVNFPHADDFSQLLIVPREYLNMSTLWDRVVYIFSLSVEHRIATLRLAALAQVKLFGALDFVLLIAWGWVLLTCATALVVWSSNKPMRPLLATTAVALLYSPVNYEAQYWATGALQHFGVIGFSFGAIHCLQRNRPIASLASLALSLAASFTSANGLMVFPAAVVVLWTSGRRRDAVIWSGLMTLLFASYFAGKDPSGTQITMLGAMIEPLRLAQFFLMTLGSLAIKPQPAMFAGAALIGTWAWLLVRYRGLIPPTLLGWFAFLVLSAAAMAVGRANFGTDGALISRYRVYSEMAVLVTLATVANQISICRARLLLWATAPLSVIWFAGSLLSNIDAITHASLLQQVRLDETANIGYSDYGAWPPAAHGGFVLSAAGEFGYFDAKRVARPMVSLVLDEGEQSSLARLPVRLDHIAQTGGVLSAFGFAANNSNTVSLWLGDSSRRYRAAMVIQPRVLGLSAGNGVKFSGTMSVVGLAPSLYRVGFSVGDSLPTAVYWTDHLVLVSGPSKKK